jgi:hypothetical protein
VTDRESVQFQLRESPWVAKLKRTPWPVTWVFTLPTHQLYVGLRDLEDQDIPVDRQPVRFRVAWDGTVRNSNDVVFYNTYKNIVPGEFVFWTLPIDGEVVATEAIFDSPMWRMGDVFSVTEGYFTPSSSKHW